MEGKEGNADQLTATNLRKYLCETVRKIGKREGIYNPAVAVFGYSSQK